MVLVESVGLVVIHHEGVQRASVDERSGRHRRIVGQGGNALCGLECAVPIAEQDVHIAGAAGYAGRGVGGDGDIRDPIAVEVATATVCGKGLTAGDGRW